MNKTEKQDQDKKLDDIIAQCELDYRDGAITFELVILLCDTDGDNRRLREWTIKHELCTAKEWDAEFRRHRIRSGLGKVPQHSEEFISLFMTQLGMVAHFNGTMEWANIPRVDGKIVTEEDMQNPLVKTFCDAKHDRKTSYNEVLRWCRLANQRYGLGYERGEIDDALQQWTADRQADARANSLLSVMYRKGRADEHKAAWKQLVEAVFDTTEHDSAFIIAVLQKFIWQVKRKMRGQEIVNHLMVVFLGRQGCGKSTFCRLLLGPVAEVVMNADFDEITDNRNIELWRNFVLFLDEMGHATKSDIDVVKNIITSPFLTRRVFYSQGVSQVTQRATLIGCSNKELNQLIRDETGLRRFAGLHFKHQPNRDVINATNWLHLWQSVNEEAGDPTEPFYQQLVDLAEEQRDRSSVEEWALQAVGYTDWTPSNVLFDDYHAWEDTYYPALSLDLRSCGKELTRLSHLPDFPFERARTKKGTEYKRRR